MNMELDDTAQTQIRVNFTTKDTDIALPEDTAPVLVPTDVQRNALSTVVNQLLDRETPIPLEFLINGTFLRTSIDEYLATNGISSETTLEVEYVRALLPPDHAETFSHDDWVSAVDVLSATSPAAATAGDKHIAPGRERILSGSYDGLLRMWNMSSQTIAVSPSAADGGHTAPVKSAKMVSPNQIVSSGFDRTVRVWKYNEEGGDGMSGSIAPQLELYGHKGSVDALAVHAGSSRMLSASTDHTVGFWSTKKSDAPAAPANVLPSNAAAAARSSKRRKIGKPSVTVPQRGPLSQFSGHTAPVSEAIFDERDSTVGYSTSWDHSLRTWDLVTSALVDTRTTAHSLLCVTHLADLHILATGTSARHITLIDPRVSATSAEAMVLRGHHNAVVSLARDPANMHGLISASHDGTCRIWDVRSTKTDTEGVAGQSVHTIPRNSMEGSGSKKRIVGGEGVKVFDVCWDKTVGMVSAGEDKNIQVNRAEGEDVGSR